MFFMFAYMDRVSEFLCSQIVTFLSFLTICKQRNSYRGLKRNVVSTGGGTMVPLALSSPPTSHPESSLAYSPPTMAAKHLNLPPVPSTVTSFLLSNAPLPTPAGWWHRPSPLPSSLARDNNDGSDIHRCSCRRVVVVLFVMLVIVLLLSIVPSRRRCHRHCHHQTTNTQWPSPSLRPPPSPLPSQSHSLQQSPPPSPCCRFHRHRRHHGHRPCRHIDDTNFLNAAIAGCHNRCSHRRRCCHRRCIRCSHRCLHRPCLHCHHHHSLY